MAENEPFFRDQDYQIHGHFLVLNYMRLDYNRHKFGFERGVADFLKKCNESGVDTILIDLQATTHVESLTLGTIVKFKKEFEKAGMKSVRLVNPSSQVEQVIRMQNLDKVFGEPFASVEEALAKG